MKAALAAQVVPLPNALFGSKRHVFNPSLLRHHGDLLLAYRANDFRTDATIGLCQLGPDFQPIAGSHRRFAPRLEPGQFLEDPRLFTFRGDLYCACTILGLEGRVQSQALWRIDAEGRELERHPLPYAKNWNLNSYDPAKTDLFSSSFHPFSTEKNWQFFEHDGALHFVYTPEPHIVVRWDLAAGKAAATYRTKARFAWPFGAPRGGTPPVRIGDEYFSFLHGRTFPKTPPFPRFASALYAATLYAFEARPPFRPTRWVPAALVEGDPFAPRGLFGSATAYPCGAIFEDGQWIVSCGVNDRNTALALFDHELLLQKSVSL